MMNIYVRQPGSPLNSIRTRRALRGVRSRHSTTVEPRASVIRVAARCRCHRGNLAGFPGQWQCSSVRDASRILTKLQSIRPR